MNENLQNGGLMIPAAIIKDLPSMVKNELGKMSLQKQEEFVEEFRRKQKSIGVAYLCWILFGCHYGFLGRWGLQVLFWITFGGCFFWWIADAFRLPGIISDVNKDSSTDILRNLKAIS